MGNTLDAGNLRYYEGLWLHIAKSDTPVVLRCSTSLVPTLIQAVRKEKTRVNTLRRTLGVARYGKLTHTAEVLDSKFTKIVFTLSYNGDKL